jgi:CubicO group peptidase (beta-lactamase class C family)
MTEVSFDSRRIDSIFAALDQCQLPGAAVGIRLQGRVVYRKGFGLASMELPVMLSPSMRLRIYSTSKQFTCLAYLLLCEQGLAGVDDTLGSYLPALHSITHGVTMRQLMGNLGGLRDPHDLTWQFSGTGRPVSSDDLLSYYRDLDDVNSAPGTAWSYQNGGFLLLSAVIEKISGQSLEAVLRERIFAPIGMHDTLLRRTDNDFVPNSATMHMIDGKGGFDRCYVGTALAGEAGMVSTVDDMLRWMAHMDAPIVGSAATWRLLKEPQYLANGSSTGYGMGLMSGDYRGFSILHHAGGGQGANSQMLKVPAAGLDLIVMTNRHDVSAAMLALEILDTCLPELAPHASAVQGPFARGVFRSPTTGRVLQLTASEQDHPWINRGDPILVMDGYDIPLDRNKGREDRGTLHPTALLSYMKMSVTPVGDSLEPVTVLFDDFGNRDELHRVVPERKSAGHFVGRYRHDATRTELTIFAAAEGVRMHTEGRFGSADFTLECLAENIWRARSTTSMSWGGFLVFSEDASGLQYTTLRTRALPFDRCE